MVGTETDMTEHPDDILRALADPERLRIAGALAGGDAAAATLAESLALPLDRVRRHLTRLAAAGVARLQPDRRTYRLDPETLRWAAEQVGPPRDAGIALGAANEDEEAVLRCLLPGWAPHRGADEGVETPDRPRARRAGVRARSPLRRARGERDRRSVLQRSRRPPPLPRRRGIPRSRGRDLLAIGRARRRLSLGDTDPRRAVGSSQSRRTGPSHRRFRTFTGEMMRLTRTGAATVTLLLLAGVLLGATPAAAHHLPGPCDFHRLDGESNESFSRRRIICAVERFGPVPGGTERATCIARRESGLDPTATSSPTGEYRGLYQHDRDMWPARYDALHAAGLGALAARAQRTDERDRHDPHGRRHRNLARGRLATRGVLSHPEL